MIQHISCVKQNLERISINLTQSLVLPKSLFYRIFHNLMQFAPRKLQKTLTTYAVSRNIIHNTMSEPNSNSNQGDQPVPEALEASESSEPPVVSVAPENNKKNRPKLKILAFHGYRQNGTTFREKIGSFRKAVAKYAQFIFISAPHKVVSEDGSSDEDARSWWFNAEDNTFSGKCLGGPALGFEDTLRLVEKVVKEHGPFDGFMGFSQGACLVGLLAAMLQKGYLQYTFKFAILASGFKSGSLVHKGFYDEEITLPSLHVYGESDSIIPKEMSESLISLFIKPIVAEHSGGHYVACSGAIKDAYQDFFHDRYQDFIEDVIAEEIPKVIDEKSNSNS